MVIGKKAYTLIEVLLAMGILTSAAFVISNLQLRSLLRIMSNRDDVEKIFLIKKELISYCIHIAKPPKKEFTKLENLGLTLTTQVSKLPAKSSLASLDDRLNFVHTLALWKHEGLQKEVTMVTFLYKAPADKEKK